MGQESEADLKIHHELLQESQAEAFGNSRHSSHDLNITENLFVDLSHAVYGRRSKNISEPEGTWKM